MANNEKSENTYTKEDEVKALRAAVEQGNAEALYKLGNEHLYGKGLPKNEDEGAKWIRKSAEQVYLQSLTEMGLCYLDGRGAMNDKMGIMWLLKAAVRGDGAARVTLRGYGYSFAEAGGNADFHRPGWHNDTCPAALGAAR